MFTCLQSRIQFEGNILNIVEIWIKYIGTLCIDFTGNFNRLKRQCKLSFIIAYSIIYFEDIYC